MFQRVRMADARTQAVAVFIVVAAVLQLTGCGSNDGASDDGSGPRATTTAPGSEDGGLDDTMMGRARAARGDPDRRMERGRRGAARATCRRAYDRAGGRGS